MQNGQLTKASMTRKTTVLFPSDLLLALEKLAKAQKTSVSALVRAAVQQQYAINSRVAKRQRQAEKLGIVEEMKRADFPFKTWQEMEKDYEETFFD
ncbi:ribbon-helix-helix protein, CopG family [candidate division KSB1 bacterium]|nr:ribbon-helix-helix protein, CopG family [candidate division KSB1 bacterium]